MEHPQGLPLVRAASRSTVGAVQPWIMMDVSTWEGTPGCAVYSGGLGTAGLGVGLGDLRELF